MKKTIILSLALLIGMLNVMADGNISLKDLTGGKYSASVPGGLTPMADGETFTQVSSDGSQVVQFSFKTGKQVGVLFDVNNTVGEKISKFDGYIMSPDGTKMLIETSTERIYRHSYTAQCYIYTIASRRLEKLSDGGPQQSPVWSPDSRQVAFVRDNNIFLVKLLYDNAESQLTKDGRKNSVINGVPDWVNEEEFSHSTALAFNADATMVCWIRYDETAVREYSLEMFKGLSPEKTENAEYPGRYTYKYPKAGQENSRVTVWSYDIQSHQTRQLQVPLDADGYIPRLYATGDAQKMIVLTTNRHQDQVNVYAVNPRSTVARLLLSDKDQKYVKGEVFDNLKVTSGHILLESDRSGHTQLYLYDLNGQLERQVTQGDRDVTDVYGYDEGTGNTYYQAYGPDGITRHVLSTGKNGKTRQLASRQGWNSATFSTGFRYFVNCWSDANTPYQYTVCDAQGKQLRVVEDNKELRDKLASLTLPTKEFFTFKTSEGVELNGVILKPANFDPQKKYPVIMWQYSGPGSQQVVNAWRLGSMGQGALYDAYLTERGFIVACVDGRGTAGHGAQFEKTTYLRLGEQESRDQVEAAIYLSSLPYVDKDNIGIWGWSYGGFNTLMSMSEGRPVFKAGVAVAPPTDWRFYDTVYTERYMRTPKENKDGYAINPMERAANLAGDLLLIHGTADDNVHFRNATEMSEALVQANKQFDMQIYTNRNHSIYGGNTRYHLFTRLVNFFNAHLK